MANYEVFYQSGTWYEVCCKGVSIAKGLRNKKEVERFVENFDKLWDWN